MRYIIEVTVDEEMINIATALAPEETLADKIDDIVTRQLRMTGIEVDIVRKY